MTTETSAGIIVFYQQDHKHEFLLLHYQAGHWDFPKGHVESGEELRETALRETKEEVNIDVELQPDFRESLSYFFRKEGLLVNKTVYFFLGHSKTKEVTLSSEHIGHIWLPFEDALKRLTFDNAKEILKKANKFLTQTTLERF